MSNFCFKFPLFFIVLISFLLNIGKELSLPWFTYIRICMFYIFVYVSGYLRPG